MNYFEVITANKTWVCPKAGIYKIIAVGGGSACGFKSYNQYISGYFYDMINSGRNTTFGNKLTAKGGVSQAWANPYTMTSFNDSYTQSFGGDGGYTLGQYGGAGGLFDSSTKTITPPSINGGIVGLSGMGYGAGGGSNMGYTTSRLTDSNNNAVNIDTVNVKSSSGEINELICDIDKGSTVICTVGKGGIWTNDVLKSKFVDIANKIKSNRSNITWNGTSFDAAIATMLSHYTAGKDGCIVVEYIGESL